MSKPTILTVDDDPLVAAAITRDLAWGVGLFLAMGLVGRFGRFLVILLAPGLWPGQ